MNRILPLLESFGLVVLFVKLYISGMFLLILPIWSLVEVGSSKILPKGRKVGWIIFLICLWGVGAIVYGIFASPNPKLRKNASILGILGSFLFITFWISQSHKNNELGNSSLFLMSDINKTQLVGIGENERKKLIQDLEVLQQEADGPWYRRYNEMKRWNLFLGFARALIQDGQLTKAKWDDWNQYFQQRKSLDQAAFNQHLLQLETSNLPATAQKLRAMLNSPPATPGSPENLYEKLKDYHQMELKSQWQQMVDSFAKDQKLFMQKDSRVRSMLGLAAYDIGNAYEHLGNNKKAAYYYAVNAKVTSETLAGDGYKYVLAHALKLDPSSAYAQQVKQTLERHK